MPSDPTRPTPGDGSQAPRGLPEWLHPLRERLARIRAEDLSSFLPPEDPKPREGAVLILFGDGPEGPDLLLTERAHTMRTQPGQVSFPGGSLDGDESPVAGALREAEEETGIDPAQVEVFAELPRVWLPPRNFAVTPVLAYWHEQVALEVVNRREVHAVFREPLEHLLDPAYRFMVKHPLGWEGPGWMIGPDKQVLLWGFTAGIIDSLFDHVGWTRPWDRGDVRTLPDRLVEWNRVATFLGIDVPEGEEFDPVAAGLVPPRDRDDQDDSDGEREHRR